jgi:hypothetical protein
MITITNNPRLIFHIFVYPCRKDFSCDVACSGMFTKGPKNIIPAREESIVELEIVFSAQWSICKLKD